MKVSRRRGRLVLRLDDVEVALLDSLLTELTGVLDADLRGDPVTQRLFPSAYPDDPDAAAEYRSLTERSLRDERRERIAQCRAELADGTDVDLSDAEAARRWIQVLNDLRLALGTRLEVSEVDAEFDPTDPQQQPRLVYHWLSMVQDTVVAHLMD